MKRTKVIIYHASEIVTCKSNQPKTKEMMKDVSIKIGFAIYIENDIIVDVDKEEIIYNKYYHDDVTLIDAFGGSVIPGLVDPHTHLVFKGYRNDEFKMRMENYSYQDIMATGGGIIRTVSQTRAASFDELYKQSKDFTISMLQYGITTIEAKSGYGLDLDTELKQLEVVKKLNNDGPMEVVSTFMGAHAIPKEYKDESSYLDFVIEKVLPIVRAKNLAQYVDIFIEKGVFSKEIGQRYLKKAQAMGFKTKAHVDELSPLGGSKIAAETKCASADHLLYASNEDIKLLAKNKVPCVLLPMTAFNLKTPYAKARMMIDDGCIVALGSDFNPGSCFSENPALTFLLANLYMNLSCEEILNAMTINAAVAIGLDKKIGSIEIGKQADIVILDYPSYTFIPYHLGVNSVKMVLKKGQIVYQKGE